MKRILFAALSSLALYGCGGGGSSDSGSNGGATVSQTSPDGLWSGTFTEAGRGTFDIQGLIYNGKGTLISSSAEVLYKGSYSMSGDTITTTQNLYEINGGLVGTSNTTGTVVEETSIDGTFTTSYGTSGTVTLAFDPAYNQPSSLDKTVGSWTATRPGYSVTIDINDSGNLSGTDSAGCTYGGSVKTIDPSKNLYDLSATISNCGSFNGTYTGFGGLFQNESEFLIEVSNSSIAFVYSFIKN